MTYFIRRQSKYRSKSTEYNGVVYHSKKEAAYARDLDLRMKAGEIKKWERQVRVPLKVYGVHICNYYIDFVVYYPSGEVEYVEVKGFETPLWRLKWKLFEVIYSKEHPEIKLTIIK